MLARRTISLIAFFIVISILSYALLQQLAERKTAEKEVLKTNVLSLSEARRVKITVVIDNNPSSVNSELQSVWGLSLYVEVDGVKLLFDTGPSPEVLEHNMRALNISLHDLNYVFISHEHHDHVGGLEYVARMCNEVKVIVPMHMSEQVKAYIRSLGLELIEVREATVIDGILASTGEMPSIVYEQALMINVKGKGLIVLVGCSHPGIVNIVKKARDVSGCRVFGVIGGFHLVGASDDYVRKIAEDLKALDLAFVMPIHCTGERAREIFKEELGEAYKDGHVGVEVILSDANFMIREAKRSPCFFLGSIGVNYVFTTPSP